MTWTEAKEYCENLGGHLVTVNDEKEWNFVSSLFSSGSKNLMWLGGYYDESSNNWRWVDGSKLTYENWDHSCGEPNRCVRNGETEKYIMTYKIKNPKLSSSTPYAWNDIFESGIFPNEENFFSTENYAFICEWDKPVTISNTGFNPDTDGNSFSHYNGSGGGFEGIDTYKLSSDYITALSSYKKTNTIKKSVKEKWGGSCFGIAMTMALNYNQRINVPNLSSSATNYYTMEKPCDLEEFLYTINYYQLAQGCKADSSAKIVNHDKSFLFDDPDNSLKKIVEITKNTNKAYVFSYGYKSGLKNHGHAIVAYGCTYDNNSDTYQVGLYDENGRKSTFISISSDYSKFSFTDGNGNKIGNIKGHSYKRFSLTDPSAHIAPPPNDSADITVTPGRVFAAQDDETDEHDSWIMVTFPENSSFTIKNKSGDYLIYDYDISECTMNINDYSVIENGSESEIVLWIDYSEEFIVTGNENKSVSLSYGDKFLSVSESQADSVSFLLEENSISAVGENCVINAYIGSETETENSDSGLFLLSSSAEGNISLSENSGVLQVDSENPIRKTNISSLTVQNTYSYTAENNTNDVFVLENDGQLASENFAAKNDINGDGVFDISDVLILKKWMLGISDIEATINTADLNDDNLINLADMIIIKNKILDIE